MKPLKSALSVSIWLMRLSFLFLIIVTFGEETIAFEYRNKEFYLATAYVLFSILIFLGGFTDKPTLTVISGLLTTLLSIYVLVIQWFNGFNPSLATIFLICTIGFFFACKGTNK